LEDAIMKRTLLGLTLCAATVGGCNFYYDNPVERDDGGANGGAEAAALPDGVPGSPDATALPDGADPSADATASPDDATAGGDAAGCPHPCDAPPPDDCVSPTRQRTFAPTGTCVSGQCHYAATERDCAAACSYGACIPQPTECSTYACDQVVPSACLDDHTMRVYADRGHCPVPMDDPIRCEYDYVDYPCPASAGDRCAHGACVAGCAPCLTTPAPACEFGPDGSGTPGFGVWTYEGQGTCRNPATQECRYEHEVYTRCYEGYCQAGACASAPACTLKGGECAFDSRLACHVDWDNSGTTLRCQGTNGKLEGDRCDRDGDCGDNMLCTSSMTPVCAYLCRNHGDCAGVGVEGLHLCEIYGGETFGNCR
jgi:hypothetical protein